MCPVYIVIRQLLSIVQSAENILCLLLVYLLINIDCDLRIFDGILDIFIKLWKFHACIIILIRFIQSEFIIQKGIKYCKPLLSVQYLPSSLAFLIYRFLCKYARNDDLLYGGQDQQRLFLPVPLILLSLDTCFQDYLPLFDIPYDRLHSSCFDITFHWRPPFSENGLGRSDKIYYKVHCRIPQDIMFIKL